ncbi:MAG: hypothetical protein QG628_789 [Patescibacteria group bacterium]|nr:hypothetical protein [Patescibacteria group bacterium]
MQIKNKRVKNIAAKGSVIIALSVLLFANGATVFAADSSLSKTGIDTGNNSTTQIRAGQANKWVISYDNKSGGPASAQVDDSIPSGSVFSTGSVQAPPSWTTNYSNDGGAGYGSSDTGASTTNLRFSNPAVAETSNGAGEISSEPLASTAQSGTGEDAYMPIPYKGRYLGIVHHSTQAGNELVCSSQISGGCDNYPVSLSVSSQTDFYTSINPLHYLDQTTGRLFFAVQRNTGYGIACWDLNVDQMCAGNEYTQLSVSGAKLGADQPSRLLGVVKAGSCLHAWDVNLRMYSFDPSTFSTTCGGNTSQNLASTYGLPVYVPSQHNVGTTNYGPVASAEVINGKVYFPVNYSFRADINLFCGLGSTNYCESSRLVCFDPADVNGQCSGWTTPSIGGANVVTRLVTGVFQDKNSSNNPCVFFVDTLATTTSTNCYNASGVFYSPASNLEFNVIANTTALAGGLMASYEEVTTTNSSGDLITVFPFTKFTNAVTSGGAGCYNWTTGDECTGWGSNSDGETTWSSINGGNTKDYGYAVDETGCLLGLGDAGWLWSFSADDGSVPCRRTVSNVTLNPSAYYCQGDGNVTGWDKVRVMNFDLSDMDKIFVTVKDSNGDPVLGYSDIDIALTAGQLDISAIPYSGLTQNVSVEVLFVALNNNPWSGSVKPVAMATFSGDDAQICYETVAQDTCNVPTIVNTANSITTMLNGGTISNKTATKSMDLVLSSGKVCGASTTTPNGINAGDSSQLGKTGIMSHPLLLLLIGLISTVGAMLLRKKGRQLIYRLR